jgi:hypothetical protein
MAGENALPAGKRQACVEYPSFCGPWRTLGHEDVLKALKLLPAMRC